MQATAIMPIAGPFVLDWLLGVPEVEFVVDDVRLSLHGVDEGG